MTSTTKGGPNGRAKPGQASKSRQERRAAAKTEAKDTARFLRTADRFIDLANTENERIEATELHMSFLFAAARYNAYVAKVILDVDNHEAYVEAMTKSYQEMLRQHLADDSLSPPKG